MTEPIDPHARDRVKYPFMTWKDDTSEQRSAVYQRRVEQALTDHPELTDDQLADDWGISVALVAEERVRRHRNGG